MMQQDSSSVYTKIEGAEHEVAEARSMRHIRKALLGGITVVVSLTVIWVALAIQATQQAGNDVKFTNTDLLAPDEVVFLPIGKVRGKRVQLGGEVRQNFGAVFKGIPYAKAQRFHAPEDPDPQEFIDATEFRPSCMRANVDRSSVSENCFHLNIYAPRIAQNSKALSAVMVWFHGGSYTMGAGSDTTDESVGELVITHRLVVVTINYRLGVFGFLGSDKLRGWSNTTGNYGILDQQAALKWVHKHIHYFGGDPDRVGIIGWSAGAASASVHLAAPSSYPYFKASIMMSGGFTGWAANTLDVADSYYESFVKAVGCDKDADCHAYGEPCQCLMGLSVDEVLDGQAAVGGGWAPTVDGTLLTQHPIDAVKDGNVHKSAHIIIGSAIEDALQDIGSDATPEMFKAFVKTRVPEKAQTDENLKTIFDLYMSPVVEREVAALPGHWQSPAYWAARRLVADQGMTCIARRAARYWMQDPGKNAYWYLWQEGSLPLKQKQEKTSGGKSHPHSKQLADSATNLLETSELQVNICWPCPGATHGSDLPFLFEEATTDVDDKMANLADEYHTFFANFLINTNPNQWNSFQMYKNGAIAWPPVHDGGMSFIGGKVETQHDLREKYCDFWDSLEH